MSYFSLLGNFFSNEMAEASYFLVLHKAETSCNVAITLNLTNYSSKP